MDLLSKNCPDYLKAQDLVDMGIFHSVNSVYGARRRGNGPTGVKVSKNLLMFKKIDVINWINKSGSPYVRKMKIAKFKEEFKERELHDINSKSVTDSNKVMNEWIDHYAKMVIDHLGKDKAVLKFAELISLATK